MTFLIKLCSLLEKYKFHNHMSKMLYNCHLLLCCCSTECQNHTLSHLFSERTVRSWATKAKRWSNKTLTIYSKMLKTCVLWAVNYQRLGLKHSIELKKQKNKTKQKKKTRKTQKLQNENTGRKKKLCQFDSNKHILDYYRDYRDQIGIAKKSYNPYSGPVQW